MDEMRRNSSGTSKPFSNDYNVTLNPKKVHLGLQTISFVGHEIDSEGINMSQKRVESTIDVIRPTNLKELYSFIGLVNYFHDHILHHATVAKPLTQMVSVANQSKTKSILWTDAGVHAFQVLKNLVNVCPKLYYIDTKVRGSARRCTIHTPNRP